MRVTRRMFTFNVHQSQVKECDTIEYECYQHLYKLRQYLEDPITINRHMCWGL